MLRRRLYAVRKQHLAGLITMRLWLWLLVERPNGRHLAPPRVSDAGMQLGIGIAATVSILGIYRLHLLSHTLLALAEAPTT